MVYHFLKPPWWSHISLSYLNLWQHVCSFVCVNQHNFSSLGCKDKLTWEDLSLLLVWFEFDLGSRLNLRCDTSGSSSVYRGSTIARKNNSSALGVCGVSVQLCSAAGSGGRVLCKQQQLNECSCLGRHGLSSGCTRIKRRGLRCPAFPTWGLS